MIAESHRAARAIPGAFWKVLEGGGVNLREAIGEYVVGYLQCHEVIGMEGDGVERIRRQAGEAEERLYRIVKIAEAAIALSEYQAFAAFYPNVEAAVYFRERGKLWEQFLAAYKAAKDASQS